MKKKFRRWLVPAFAAAMSMAAAIPAFAAETVNVTIPNVKGGYFRASYYAEDDGTRVYLPIGETSQVPKGTSLMVNAYGIDYRPSDTKRIESFLASASVNGEELEVESNYGHWNLSAEEDMKFDATFKGHEKTSTVGSGDIELVFVNSGNEFSMTTGMYNAGVLPQKQLTMYDYENEKNLGFSGVENLEIEYVYYYNEEDDYENVDDGLFAVDAKGILRASEALKKGEYGIRGEYEYNGDRCDFYLDVYVGAAVDISIPFAQYQYRASSKSNSRQTFHVGQIYVDNIGNDTFQQIFNKYNALEEKSVLANHTLTGLGIYNSSSGKYTSILSRKISERITSEEDPRTTAYLMFENYNLPTIQHLEESDIVPENVTPGWNQQGGKWFYYENSDPGSLVKNSWLSCPDNDGEMVWAGSDGAVVTNGIVKVDGNDYLVDSKGHKITDASITIGDVDYVVDSNGIVIEAKLHLATPSNADEAVSQVDKVLENQDSMSQEDKEKAADMLTEALKNDIDVTKLTAEELAKYDELYKAAFGADNIVVEGSAQSGAIAAAGLTSADFASGSVTIEYVSGWIGSSSNAQERVEIKLLVNDAERTPLSVPVTVEIELPEEFIASYSNATYNFEVKDAKDVTVDTENGVLKMTVTRAGIFEIKAVLKQTYRPSGGKSSSSKGGRATVAANYQKSGQWILNDVGWWYRYDDGTWPAGTWAYLPWQNESKWYYFNADGYMATGWHRWNSNYYYLYPVADGNRGYMFTGWHEIGGKWYYFSDRNDISLGAMAYNTTTPDGYKVDKDGAWIK